MKKISIFILFWSTITTPADQISNVLSRYKTHLEEGTYQGQDWSIFETKPKSRYHTFKYAFEYFEQNNGKTVVELGTTRSFTHGGSPGCNTSILSYWTPQNPENWDWGAGFFTRMVAESLAHLKPTIHTIDLDYTHIYRSAIITYDFRNIIQYHVCSSYDFLKQVAPQSIDLLYLDTGNMTPVEETAQLQLAEARIVVERNVLSPNGIILIDDVRNQTPRVFGDTSGLGKAKYSIHYFLANGYEILMDEYQVILRRKKA
jgi:hypothetical protein